HGYLVFVPDIKYRTGFIGQSAYNAVVGASEYLKKLRFVDRRGIGLSGHSFGGFETNYLITHSGIFAAACSDAGMTNFISQYGSYELNAGISLQQINERGQNRMGATPWENLDVYIKNSPIFNVHKVTTPVLLINNKEDAIVHFEQGVQFFNS